MTKAEIVFEKDAKLGKKFLAASLLALGLAAPKADAQLGWLKKNTIGPLVENLSGSRAMPALDTTAKSISPVSWVSKTHPHFNDLTKEMREAMGDNDLNFKGFRIDSAQSNNRRFINIFGTDADSNITHRLFRNEAIPGPRGNSKLVDREQWADEISASTANAFLKQREGALVNKNKRLLTLR